MKKIIAIDLDGVLAKYDGWQGPDVYGEPIPGAMKFLQDLINADMQPVLFTTRKGNGLSGWVEKYLPEEVKANLIISNTKQPAWLYIDDRCFLFQGRFPTCNEINDFKPWWEQ